MLLVVTAAMAASNLTAGRIKMIVLIKRGG